MEKLILAVGHPDDNFYAALASEMRSLRASGRSWQLNSWDPNFTGSLEEVVRALRQVVDKDWCENAGKTVPWKFEYQLLRVSGPVDHIQVLTRFFSPPDPQSIFYGQEVARISQKEFVAWASD